MDPDAALKDLLDAVHGRERDRVEVLAEGLLSWMEKRGFPPTTLGPKEMGRSWHQTIATFVCHAAQSKVNRSQDENAELASKVFELSQTLTQKWLTADYAEKRKILEIVWLNCRLVDATLVPTIRKPFDVLAEGLISKESGGGGN